MAPIKQTTHRLNTNKKVSDPLSTGTNKNRNKANDAFEYLDDDFDFGKTEERGLLELDGVSNANGMLEEDNILDTLSTTNEFIRPREYSQKGVCTFCTAFHFVLVFRIADIATLPLHRPHPASILSTTREHECDRPTTTALPTLQHP